MQYAAPKIGPHTLDSAKRTFLYPFLDLLSFLIFFSLIHHLGKNMQHKQGLARVYLEREKEKTE